MIVVSKNSRLYKTYSILSRTMIFSLFSPRKDYSNHVPAFRDLCTFLRTTLLYLFLAIPLWILFLGAIGNLIYQIIISVITFQLQPAPLVVGFILAAFGILGLMIGTIALGCVLLDAITKSTNRSEFIGLVKEAVVSKHEKICKTIKVVEKEDA